MKELESIRGRHTELVSVYVPSGYNLNDIINQLYTEKSTASNIKSKGTRKNVLDALEKIIQHLRIFKHTPPNGLIVFCGNVSEVEGKDDLKIWSFEPPEKMNTKMYWCDQVFVLDPLRDMVAEKEVYGLIVLDSSEADIGVLHGKRITPMKHIDSLVAGKAIKGGMCLSPETLITTQNGNKRIDDLKIGDKLVSYDFNSKKFVDGVCSDIMKRRSEISYEIFVNGSKIEMTPEHLVFVVNKKAIIEKYAEDLKKGDTILLLKDGEIEKEEIKKKNRIIVNKNFYDISVEKFANFVANGIVVHNSQRRYDRIREDAIIEYFKEVASIASDIFLKQKELKGVIIGGPGPIKDQFVKGEYLNHQLIPKIIGVKDIGYTGDHGFEELVQRSQDLLKEAAVMKERQLVQKFLTEIQKGGNAVYGYTQTIEALNMGVIENLLVSEEFEWARVKLKCDNTHEAERDLPESEIERQICDVCGQSMKVIDKDYLGELLSEKAQNFGTKVDIISTDTQEGMQFKQLGGIGGFLRYKIR